MLDAPFATPLACTEPVRRDGIPALVDEVWRLGGATLPCADGAAAVAAVLSGRDACLLANAGLVAAHDALLVTGPVTVFGSVAFVVGLLALSQ